MTLMQTQAQTDNACNRSPSCLSTRSKVGPGHFIFGNGASIYESTILPALEAAEHEIILVTCFWARSHSLDLLSESLVRLSRRAESRPQNSAKLQVRLCFSSRSLTQKLFHTSSPDGYTYPPSTWTSKLGLPFPEYLSGLDVQIKSLFFLPFSVMHPKFVILDRKRALIPSCNLSYESWLEGCLHLKGPIVDELLKFWKDTWYKEDLPAPDISSPPTALANDHREATTQALASSHTITLLPSPYHRHPHFRPFIRILPPPPTPLNVYLSDILLHAKSSIKILTPNLTSPPVIEMLLDALARGVDVTVITNRRMMVLEQLLTAGTLTETCVWRLKRRHKKLLKGRQRSRNTNDTRLVESGDVHIGQLSNGYFRPSTVYAKSHIKCTIVDDKVVVLGSGNMDRASWYTSQELGIAVEERDLVNDVWEKVSLAMGLDDGNGEEAMRWVEWV